MKYNKTQKDKEAVEKQGKNVKAGKIPAEICQENQASGRWDSLD